MTDNRLRPPCRHSWSLARTADDALDRNSGCQPHWRSRAPRPGHRSPLHDAPNCLSEPAML